jgi:hypothetical protein
MDTLKIFIENCATAEAMRTQWSAGAAAASSWRFVTLHYLTPGCSGGRKKGVV